MVRVVAITRFCLFLVFFFGTCGGVIGVFCVVRAYVFSFWACVGVFVLVRGGELWLKMVFLSRSLMC